MRRIVSFVTLQVMAVVLLSGCSLITVNTGIVALTEKEIETRVMTREFALRFVQSVNTAAIEIDERSSEAAVELAALRWRVGAVTASRQAALQTAPALALLDTWSLAEQQKRYFAPGGAGESLFGEQQHVAVETADELAGQIDSLAARLLTREDYDRYRKVMLAYVEQEPITSLRFDRESVLYVWTELSEEEHSLVTSVGTSAQVVNDLTDRLRVFGEQFPDQVALGAKIQMRESGLEATDVKQALDTLKNDLDRLATLAETSPDLVRQAVANFRHEFDPTIVQLQGRMDEAMDRFSAERVALAKDLDALREGLAASVAEEREAIAGVVASERAAMMSDARLIANDVTEKSWTQLRALMLELGFILIILAIIVLGLPFAGGYFLGKAVASRQHPNA